MTKQALTLHRRRKGETSWEWFNTYTQGELIETALLAAKHLIAIGYELQFTLTDIVV